METVWQQNPEYKEESNLSTTITVSANTEEYDTITTTTIEDTEDTPATVPIKADTADYDTTTKTTIEKTEDTPATVPVKADISAAEAAITGFHKEVGAMEWTAEFVVTPIRGGGGTGKDVKKTTKNGNRRYC